MVIAEVIVERVRSTKIGTTSFPVVLGEISIVTSPDELDGRIRQASLSHSIAHQGLGTRLGYFLKHEHFL